MSTRDPANKPALPEGWSAARVADVIAHYQTQSEDEAVAEDEAALSRPGQTVMVIPTSLVPAVRKLLGEIDGDSASALADEALPLDNESLALTERRDIAHQRPGKDDAS